MILLIFLAGLFLRLLLLPLPAFPIDMTDWIAWAEHLTRVGPGSFYTTIWSDYLPAYLYILWFLSFLHRLIPQIPYEILMKIPSLLADLTLGYLIFKLVKEETESEKCALLASSFLLFNPALVFNSSVWGQIDSFFTLLLFLSVYFLTEKKEALAFIFLAISFLIKPQVIFFLPLFFLYLLREKRAKRFCLSLSLFLATIFVISYPFFLHDPILGLPKLILKSASTYPYASVFAMNFWGIFGTWKPDSQPFLGLSYQIWGFILLCFGVVLALVVFLRDGKLKSIFLSSSLIVLAYFMLPTRVHERWLYPFFPFFLVLAVRLNNLKLWFIYFLLSAIHFFNLYYVYTYYSPNFFKIESVVGFIGKNFSRFSIISVLIYGFLTLWSLKGGLSEKT